MRIALISDIHANLYAFEAVMHDLRRQRVDLTVFLGDLVYDGIYPSECISLLSSIDPLVALKGNADAWFDDTNDPQKAPPNDHRRAIHSWVMGRMTKGEIEWIRSFKPSESLVDEGVSIGFFHGSPRSYTDRIYSDDPEEEVEAKLHDVGYDVVALGHTHVRMNIQRGNVKIVNPGAIGISNDGDTRAGYGILTIGETVDYEQRDIVYPIEQYAAELERSEIPCREILAEQIRTGEPNKSLFRAR